MVTMSLCSGSGCYVKSHYRWLKREDNGFRHSKSQPDLVQERLNTPTTTNHNEQKAMTVSQQADYRNKQKLHIKHSLKIDSIDDHGLDHDVSSYFYSINMTNKLKNNENLNKHM